MRLMKGSLPECAATLSRENGLDAEELLRCYHAEAVLHPGEVSPMPGIPEALEALTRAGCRHYLATHRRAEDAMALLAGCGLDHWFTAAVCPQQGFPRKPAPDMLLHLMERFHLPPEKCVMIGDRPLDVQAGGARGCLPAWWTVKAASPRSSAICGPHRRTGCRSCFSPDAGNLR